MAEQLKPGDGHNSGMIRDLIRECCADMMPIIEARKRLNEKAGKVRGRLKDAGVHIPAFDLAFRVWSMEDEAAKASYQEGIRTAFAALDLGEQGAMFSDDDAPAVVRTETVEEGTEPSPPPSLSGEQSDTETSDLPTSEDGGEDGPKTQGEDSPEESDSFDTYYDQYVKLSSDLCKGGEMLLLGTSGGDYLCYGPVATFVQEAAVLPNTRLKQVRTTDDEIVGRIGIEAGELADKIGMVVSDGYAVIVVDVDGAIARHDPADAA